MDGHTFEITIRSAGFSILRIRILCPIMDKNLFIMDRVVDMNDSSIGEKFAKSVIRYSRNE